MPLPNRTDLPIFITTSTIFDNSQGFKHILKIFMPKIKYLSLSYPKYWREDCLQEGIIGLNEAILKFPQTASPNAFYSYAVRTISSRMIDFYRSKIKNSSKIDSYMLEESEDDTSPYNHIPDLNQKPEYILQNIDIQSFCSEKYLLKLGYSQRDIKIFMACYFEEYTIVEIAEEFRLSASQVSKIITKIKITLNKILN